MVFAICLVLVEPRSLAVLYGLHELVLHAENLDLGSAVNWRVYYRNRLWQNLLVAELVVDVDCTQEQVELRVSVDPTDCQQAATLLCIKQGHLICYDELVLLSVLLWHNQSSNYEIPVSLLPAKDCSGLD